IADCDKNIAGQPLSEVFGASAVHALRNQLSLLRSPQGTARLFSLALAGSPRPIDTGMSRMGDTILLEAVPAAPDPGDPIGTVRALAALLDRHVGLAELLGEGARQLRALTGFERVTIFRYTDDGQAEQIAHEARGKHGAPAPPEESDGLRMIGDVGSDPVPVDPPPGDGLLSSCLLRFPSKRECAEARANNAVASLTLPLRSRGRDWGVALCLNSGPKRPMLDRIAAAELFADLLAMRAELCALRG
ncbi:MAG: GAF domain-containing protein, partial [Sphingomicrobium sp.]